MRNFMRKGGTTTREWATRWLEEQEILAPRTVLFYRQKLALILPILGDDKLGDLSPSIIHQAIIKLSGSGVGATTVAHVHTTLKTMLKAALIQEHIARHPMALLTTPPRSHFVAQTLTLDQAKRLCEACRGHRLGTAVIIAALTGMRSGEVLALEWPDVDLISHSISVNKTVRWVRGGRVIQPPKTHSAYRSLPISPGLSSVLRKHWDVQGQKHERRLVIATGAGNYVSPSSGLRTYFAKALLLAECPPIRFHDLRHTAGLFLTRRYGLVVASRMLGHASPLITARYYGHAPMEDLRAAADGMGDLLAP